MTDQRLHNVLTAARAYQDLPDPGHLLAALAVATTAALDEEPAWLLLVAPPSSGKTETTRALDGMVDAHMDDVTGAGLLSWRAGKDPKPTGLLTRIGEGARALVTIGDLSTLLASSDRGGRDTTFALLRKMYDGHVVRDLGSAPAALAWRGKVTIVGAVTGAIDNYSAHADALGPRWLYYRLPERTTGARRRASRMARAGGLAESRRALATATSAAVREARDTVASIAVGEDLADVIEDAALVTCWGRAAVPRNGYGRREIDGMPVVEEPMRLIRQLHVAARGALALGMEEEDVATLTRRMALDSMPAARLAVLRALADGAVLPTAGVARAAGLHRHVARFQLEELEAIGVVHGQRSGADPDDDSPDHRRAEWELDGDDGDLIADVFNDARVEQKRWHEVWAAPTPPPLDHTSPDAQDGDAPYTSCHPSMQVSDQTGTDDDLDHAALGAALLAEHGASR